MPDQSKLLRFSEASVDSGSQGVDPTLRVVMRIPLSELWNDAGTVTHGKRRPLRSGEIAAMLEQGKIRFVVANCGDQLKWIPPSECYGFWKTEAKFRVADIVN